MENETQHEGEHGQRHERKVRSNRKHLIITAVIVGIVIVIGILLTWLYTGQISGAKQGILKAIPLPAALVDMKPVSAKSVIERVELAKQLSQLQPTGEEPTAGQTYEQLLDSKKMEAVARQKNLSVNQGQIDEEYGNIITQYADGDAEAFKAELEKTYRMTPEEFKSQVVRQELLEAELLIWYNNQQDLNKAGYDTAKNLQTKLDNGESFDDVAKTYTQDAATQDFAGDSGMIAYDDLLPEFRNALQDNKVGDIELVSSRYGLHILKVLELNNDGENGAKQIHLQQIFVEQKGFTDWITKESDKVKVVKFLNFA